MYKLCFVFLFLQFAFLSAQNEIEYSSFISEEINEYEWIEEQNELSIYLEANPVDLNNTSKEELERSGLFSSEQIENILFYVYVYGEMKSIYELKMVKDMDYNTIQKVLPYVTVLPKKKEQKAYLNQSINLSFRNYITKPDGYININDSLLRVNKKYIGDPAYYGLLYNGKYGDNLQWGIAFEKDAGEKFGFVPDYTSFFFHYRSTGKHLLKQIIIGSFKLRFAQGLVMNNTYETGYSSLHSFKSTKSLSLKNHNSFSESGYHKGIAMLFQKSKFQLLLYGSSNKIDASVQDSFITSINQSGKHNTLGTLERKENENITSFGGNVNCRINNLDFGLSSAINYFSKPIMMSRESLSNRFYFRGETNSSFSFNWMFKNRYLKIYGEEAYSNSSFAFINNLLIQPSRELLISFSQRYYSPEYYSFHGRVFGNSNIRNEEGYYFYATMYAGLGFYLSANIDYYKSLWAVSGSDFPKDGLDLRVRFENRKLDKCLFSFLYKRSKREKEQEDTYLSNYIINKDYRSSYSLRITYEYSAYFLSQSLLEYSELNSKLNKNGFHLSQIFTYRTYNGKSKIQGIISVFEGNDGISFYSPLRHNMYSATGERISGKGYKIQLNLSYIFSPSLSSFISYSLLHKSYTSSFGNGLERIDGRNRQLCSLLIRYKFR